VATEPPASERRLYGYRFVGMVAVAGDAGRQNPLAQVLEKDWKRDPDRQIGVVEVETKQHLSKRLVTDQDQRSLQAGDECAAEFAVTEILAASDVHVLQVHVGQQRIARIRRAHAADADGCAARECGSCGRVDRDERSVR
jgi:hypothetical protein